MPRSDASVGALLHRAWIQNVGPGRSPCAPRLTPSDAERFLLREAASVSAAGVRMPVGSLQSEPRGDEAEWLNRRLAEPSCWTLVEALASAADALAAQTTALIDAGERPSDLTPGRVSERACTVVAAFHREPPHRVPTPADLDGEAAAFVGRACERAGRLRGHHSEAEFVRMFGPVYDALWAERGAAALAEVWPSAIGVGRRDRPPMTGKDNSWRAGTDRSVGARYRYHLRTAWAQTVEADGVDRENYIDRRLARMNAEDLGVLVVERACAPLGLRLRPLCSLVRSFARGVELADLQTAADRTEPPAPRTLYAWADAEPRLSDDPEDELALAVAREAEGWVRRGAQAREIVDGIQLKNPGGWTAQLQRGTTRRLWHHAHAREAQWEAPFTRAETRRLVPRMFSHHLRELINSPVPDDPVDLIPEIMRLGELMDRNPDLRAAIIRLMVTRDPRWATVYDVMTEDLGDERLTSDRVADLWIGPEDGELA